MKVAAIQLKIWQGGPAENRRQTEALLREAADRGAVLAVLPELWPTGFCLERLDELAESLRGESVAMLRKLARELKLFIVGGSVAEKKDGCFYNTSVAVNEAGEIAAKYRKTHLYPYGLREADYFSPGDDWTLTACRDLTIGMMVCYDAYFPEFARNLCLRGAQLLTVPGAWDDECIERFQILAKARAVENHAFVIIANDAADPMAGRSMIISPYGRVLAESGREQAVITAELDQAELALLRENRNTINDRRNILDEIDNSQL